MFLAWSLAKAEVPAPAAAPDVAEVFWLLFWVESYLLWLEWLLVWLMML